MPSQLTKDHTLVDAGRLRPNLTGRGPDTTNAAGNLLMKALDGAIDVEPRPSIREVRCWRLIPCFCTDGLVGGAAEATISAPDGGTADPIGVVTPREQQMSLRPRMTQRHCAESRTWCSALTPLAHREL